MSIVENKKAFHDYFIEQRFEAGIALEGWEVKAIRAGRVQLREGYVIVSHGEIFLVGCHISPLPTASTHVSPDPTRTRKLLLHAGEIDKLIGSVERAGYALVPLNMHYSRRRIKLEIGLAKGKKQHDKRETIKNRDWGREKQRLFLSQWLGGPGAYSERWGHPRLRIRHFPFVITRRAAGRAGSCATPRA